jgi:hypothetical protein
MAHPKMVIYAPRNHAVAKRMERRDRDMCVASSTLTLDLVNEHMITVSEMHEAGMNMQQVRQHHAMYLCHTCTSLTLQRRAGNLRVGNPAGYDQLQL